MNSTELSDMLDRACQLQADGRIDESLVLFRELEREGFAEKSVIGMLGLLLYYHKHDAESALPYLRRSVSLSPDSERASIGLFHALMHSGDEDAAFGEMRRFLADHSSDEYDQLLSDINREERK